MEAMSNVPAKGSRIFNEGARGASTRAPYANKSSQKSTHQGIFHQHQGYHRHSGGPCSVSKTCGHSRTNQSLNCRCPTKPRATARQLPAGQAAATTQARLEPPPTLVPTTPTPATFGRHQREIRGRCQQSAEPNCAPAFRSCVGHAAQTVLGSSSRNSACG